MQYCETVKPGNTQDNWLFSEVRLIERSGLKPQRWISSYALCPWLVAPLHISPLGNLSQQISHLLEHCLNHCQKESSEGPCIGNEVLWTSSDVYASRSQPVGHKWSLGSSQPQGCPEAQSYHMLGIENWKYLANGTHDSSKSTRGTNFPERKSEKS